MLTRGTRCATRAARRLSSASPKVRARAFTLVELMVVVVIAGILATLATYGVRKYVLEAKKSEAIAMLTQIRAAEESYRDEAFVYLGATSLDSWHPTNDPSPGKRSWETSTTMGNNVLRPLGVQPDGPVAYSYLVYAGTTGTALPTFQTARTLTFPTPNGPFYIAAARADLNGDGAYTYAITHSATNETYLEDNF